jgi:hypothetical protein
MLRRSGSHRLSFVVNNLFAGVHDTPFSFRFSLSSDDYLGSFRAILEGDHIGLSSVRPDSTQIHDTGNSGACTVMMKSRTTKQSRETQTEMSCYEPALDSEAVGDG